MTRTFTRRAALVTGVAVASGPLSGCFGDKEESLSLTTHPAGDGLKEAPTLGPDPSDAEAVIVAFEDPSCSSCAAFADSTLPKLRSEMIDAGRATYAWRGVPSVEPWGRPATRALWAVHERDPDGFWTLKEGYYDERDAIDTDTVADATRSLLDDLDVNVDPDTVVGAMDGGNPDIEDHVAADEAAAKENEVDTLPGFVLFRGGSYVTTVVGNQPYGVFEGALEL